MHLERNSTGIDAALAWLAEPAGITPYKQQGGNMNAQPTCKERWAANKDGRIADLRQLWALYQEGGEDSDSDLGTFN